MNSSKEYKRQKINSFNQQFVYYEQTRHSHHKSREIFYMKQEKDTNHAKISDMRKTLTNMYETVKPSNKISFIEKSQHSLNDGISSKQQHSVSQKQTDQNTKSSVNLNQKLARLNSNLRQIAQKFQCQDKSEESLLEWKQWKKGHKDQKKQKSSFNNSHSVSQFNDVQRNRNDSSCSFANFLQTSQPQNYSQQLSRYDYVDQNSYLQKQVKSVERMPKARKDSSHVGGQKQKKTFFISKNDKNTMVQVTRKRGKSDARINDKSSTSSNRIKIESYLENSKSSERLPSTRSLAKKLIDIQDRYQITELIQIGRYSSHRAAVTEIVKARGKQNVFITSSNDYKVNITDTETGKVQILRNHTSRVICLLSANGIIFSGGDDCKLKSDSDTWRFTSPVSHILSCDSSCFTIGTRSEVLLFDLEKKTEIHQFGVSTRNYQLLSKSKPDIYFGDNHSLSLVDWRVPYPEISLVKSQQYVLKWVSDPLSVEFYQLRGNMLYQGLKNTQICVYKDFDCEIIGFKWYKGKLYTIGQQSLTVLDAKRNFKKISQFSLNSASRISSFHVDDKSFVYGTSSGTLVSNKL